jgi:hypothetical protein
LISPSLVVREQSACATLGDTRHANHRKACSNDAPRDESAV